MSTPKSNVKLFGNARPLTFRKSEYKNELFSIEGSGTLIANNINQTFEHVNTKNNIQMIASILKRYRSLGYMKYVG